MSDIEKNKGIIRTFRKDAIINHGLNKLSRYMRDEYIQHNPDCPQGKAGFIEFFQAVQSN